MLRKFHTVDTVSHLFALFQFKMTLINVLKNIQFYKMGGLPSKLHVRIEMFRCKYVCLFFCIRLLWPVFAYILFVYI